MNDRLIGGPSFQVPNVSLDLVVDEIKVYKSTVQDIVFAIPNAQPASQSKQQIIEPQGFAANFMSNVDATAVNISPS